MATDRTRTVGGDAPDDPADLLPEESILSLDEYLDMHAAVGHRTRYSGSEAKAHPLSGMR